MGLRPPFETFAGATCKGCYALGTACGSCEKCKWERAEMEKEKVNEYRHPVVFEFGGTAGHLQSEGAATYVTGSGATYPVVQIEPIKEMGAVKLGVIIDKDGRFCLIQPKQCRDLALELLRRADEVEE